MHVKPSVSPSQSIIDKESEHILLCFCTYCSLLRGKRLSLQNVSILVLDDEKIKSIKARDDMKNSIDPNALEAPKCSLKLPVYVRASIKNSIGMR